MMKGYLLLISLAVFISGQHSVAQRKAARLYGLTDSIVCTAGTVPSDLLVPPPHQYRNRLKSEQQAGASFIIDFSEGFPEEGKTAAQYALDLWGSLIYSPVPIKVNVSWGDLGPYTLASATIPDQYLIDENGALPERGYPSALAEKLLQRNLNGDEADIRIKFNSLPSWHWGTDQDVHWSRYDFATTFLHEIGHGLGFFGAFFVYNGLGYYTWRVPLVFDHFLYNAQNKSMTDTSRFPVESELLARQLTTTGIHFRGPVTKLQAGEYPYLYVPSVWDDGSSLYHLHPIYGDGPNALMTHIQSPGASVHDPGPLTTNMMYEIGWVHTYIEHDSLLDRESLDEAFTVKAVIRGEKGIKAGSQSLYYAFDDQQDFVAVPMSPTGNPDEFTADIPVSRLETGVKYYIQTEDNFSRKYTLPPVAPAVAAYQFRVGTDTTFPVIEHDWVRFLLTTAEDMKITAKVWDNLGLDLLQVEYSINDASQAPVTMNLDTLTDYSCRVEFSGGQLIAGDIIKYRIRAVDGSVSMNTACSPDTGFYQVVVEEIPDFVDEYQNDFELAENDFITKGFTRSKPESFTSYGLHTEHKYPAPNRDNDTIELYAQLRIPIRLKTADSYMYFEEIAYIEEGESGSRYGDEGFYDYVIVEGSRDGGVSWHPFEDGWDVRKDTAWFNNWQRGPIHDNENFAVPSESDFRPHKINLLGNGYFQGNDVILIRFRLFSDWYYSGWGWAIDNLKIQGEVSGTDSYLFDPFTTSIYPNPSSGVITVVAQFTGNIPEMSIEMVDLLGRTITSEIFSDPGTNFMQRIDISELPDGVYFVEFKAGNQRVTKKVVLAR